MVKPALADEFPFGREPRKALTAPKLKSIPAFRLEIALRLLLLISLLAIGGCASLPHDGPTAGAVQKKAGAASGGYTLIDIDYRTTELISATPPRALATLLPSSSNAPVDQIGEGDVLAVTLYAAGSGPTAGSDSGPGDEKAQQGFPRLVVDSRGSVSIPFAGDVQVRGLTTGQAAAAIRKALAGRMMNPQVSVVVAANVTNSVIVIGEVRTPGRFPLSVANDRLLEILASAGGPSRPAADTSIAIIRGSKTVTTSLAAVLREPSENIRLAPRDQIRLVYKPRKYSTFGALSRSSQTPIEDETLSLAAAISRSGGLDNSSANASSVLVFRFERPEVVKALGVTVEPAGDAGVPVVYRLDFREPAGYFSASKFQIEPDDLVYVPRADTAELGKFFELIRTITQVAYDLRVTAVLP